MRWLSSRQALADISLFHSYITQQFKLSPRNKWVSWGGSYPGMMAAFSRLKYVSCDDKTNSFIVNHSSCMELRV